jgi:uncharacterized repeat protein (TIGR01451 family)
MKLKMKSGNELKSRFVKILFLTLIFITIGVVVSAQVPPPQNNVSVEVTPAQQTGMPGDTLTYNINLRNNGNVPDIIVVELITDIPTGWIVELKDDGVTQTLPYQTPLLQSKANYLLILNVQVASSASVGTSNMSISIHSFADNSKSDSAIVSATVSTQALTPTATAYHSDGGGDGVLLKVTPDATSVIITPTPITTTTPEAPPILIPTPTPFVTPTPSPTPTPKPLGFEGIFAITGLLVIAYLLRRRK